jgi:D-psicose/D-tagatose/L-ribulose 3-epimerase
VNPLGANTWIWVSPLSDGRLAKLAPQVRDFGFDMIELQVENPGDWDAGRAAELLAEHGLGASLCAVMPPGRDLLGDSAEVASTQDYLRHCVDVAARIGSRAVGGPLYSAVGRTWLLGPGERRATIARLAETLRPIADYAGEHNVGLALEPLNRYETSLINTAEQGLEVVEAVESPALGLLLDTYHMNIEEKNPAEAIRAAGSRLVHVHACGSDRGTPGADHLDWPGIARALREVGYDGAVCIESFTSENKTIAVAASIWRPLAPTQDALARDGLTFLRTVLAA